MLWRFRPSAVQYAPKSRLAEYCSPGRQTFHHPYQRTSPIPLTLQQCRSRAWMAGRERELHFCDYPLTGSFDGHPIRLHPYGRGRERPRACSSRGRGVSPRSILASVYGQNRNNRRESVPAYASGLPEAVSSPARYMRAAGSLDHAVGCTRAKTAWPHLRTAVGVALFLPEGAGDLRNHLR